MRYSFFFLLLIALVGKACSCKTAANGVVVDAKTLQPIEGVQIQISFANIHGDTLDQPTVTDAAGYFECTHFYCNKYQLDVVKEGYVIHTQDPALKDTIRLMLLEDME